MIQFHSGNPPKGFKQDFESFLFNTKTHRLLQAKIGWKEYHLLNTESKTILSSIYFHVRDKKAASPYRAPFGSYEISQMIKAKDFSEFSLFVESELRKSAVQNIEIVCPPELYNKQQPLITTTLLGQNYSVKSDPGCCIQVDEKPLSSKMLRDKHARLKKSEKEKLDYRSIPLTELESIYSFIDRNYKKLDRKLSMSLLELVATVKALPQSFFLVGAYQKNKLATASICVKVNKSIVYTFYSAHSDIYDNLSPRIFMLNYLYDWCYTNHVTLLDLGTSSLGGTINFGLLDFKRRVGGTLTPKYTFQKVLA